MTSTYDHNGMDTRPAAPCLHVQCGQAFLELLAARQTADEARAIAALMGPNADPRGAPVGRLSAIAYMGAILTAQALVARVGRSGCDCGAEHVTNIVLDAHDPDTGDAVPMDELAPERAAPLQLTMLAANADDDALTTAVTAFLDRFGPDAMVEVITGLTDLGEKYGVDQVQINQAHSCDQRAAARPDPRRN